MIVEKADLDGVLVITPPTMFEDFRGEYVETYNRALYKEHGIGVDFVQDDLALSRKHVLRGIHGDPETAKRQWAAIADPRLNRQVRMQAESVMNIQVPMTAQPEVEQ